MYYHAWLRLEGGSHSLPNFSRDTIQSSVVVPFINKQVKWVPYGAHGAILNFSAVTYLAVVETAEKLEGPNAGAQALHLAVMNGTLRNCTHEILEEAWTSRADEGAKSLIQRALEPPKHQVFVVMRFGDRVLDSAYEGVIRPVVRGYGYDCLRIDEVRNAGLISEQILEAIATSEVVLCELSGGRPNCYYETGFAHALGRALILSIREGEERHFDLAGRRFITWVTDTECKAETCQGSTDAKRVLVAVTGDNLKKPVVVSSIVNDRELSGKNPLKNAECEEGATKVPCISQK